MRHPSLTAAMAASFLALMTAGCAAGGTTPDGTTTSAAGPATPLPDYADGARPVGAKIDCIDTHQIRETIVRDDRTIDFRLNNGRIIRNTLPNRCPQLGFERAFSYATSINRLCAVDIITVLTRTGGLRPGISCGLGDFQPVELARRGG